MPDDALGDFSNRQAAGAHGDDKSAEIVNAADEKGADDDPEHGGRPPPDDRDGGTEHGCQAGDRCVVVAEKNEGPRGHVVDAVVERVGGSRGIGAEAKNMFGEVPSVECVSEKVEEKATQRGEQRIHGRPV